MPAAAAAAAAARLSPARAPVSFSPAATIPPQPKAHLKALASSPAPSLAVGSSKGVHKAFKAATAALLAGENADLNVSRSSSRRSEPLSERATISSRNQVAQRAAEIRFGSPPASRPEYKSAKPQAYAQPQMAATQRQPGRQAEAPRLDSSSWRMLAQQPAQVNGWAQPQARAAQPQAKALSASPEELLLRAQNHEQQMQLLETQRLNASLLQQLLEAQKSSRAAYQGPSPAQAILNRNSSAVPRYMQPRSQPSLAAAQYVQPQSQRERYGPKQKPSTPRSAVSPPRQRKRKLKAAKKEAEVRGEAVKFATEYEVRCAAGIGCSVRY
jgi:hypothetical protein